MSHQIVPVKTYIVVFASLIGLTLLTTGVAFIDLGAFNTVAALVIAFCKMLLVIFFFMHMRPRRSRARSFARGFFLAGTADFAYDERLSHTLVDAGAGRLVDHCAAHSPVIPRF